MDIRGINIDHRTWHAACVAYDGHALEQLMTAYDKSDGPEFFWFLPTRGDGHYLGSAPVGRAGDAADASRPGRAAAHANTGPFGRAIVADARPTAVAAQS